tara:strand:+ start:442 stop:1497 length:1056 start_codon:yes stop_codon:yes gene_type:complete
VIKKIIEVGGNKIGDGQPCFLVAEIGLNHNGDLALAKDTIDAAVEAGASAVKFQNYKTEDFLSDRTLTHEYRSDGGKITESQYEMFKRCELTVEMLSQLKDYSDQKGIIFFSTPTSIETLYDLTSIGVPILKNGSDFLTHLPLVQAMAATRIPTVLATGMSTRLEIEDAVNSFRAAGGEDLILLHCTSSYPTEPADVHLRKIISLREKMDCLVGLSDHTDGITAGIGSVLLGACFIEKHFTLNKKLPGPDHSFSMDPVEFNELTKSIRTLETQLGESELGPTMSEDHGRQNYRLSCVAATDFSKGYEVRPKDVVFRRPGNGLPPKSASILHGKSLKRGVLKGHVFTLEDFS